MSPAARPGPGERGAESREQLVRPGRSTARAPRTRTLLPAPCSLLLLLLPTAAHPQSRQWRPEDRAVIGDFSNVAAVAATTAGVFAVTTGGIVVYDTRFDRWLPPVTAIDGWPPGVPLTAIGDPADQSVWIGYADRVVHYTPVIRLFETVPLPDGVRELVFDRDDPFRGLYVRTSREWLMIPRGAPTTMPVFDVPPNERRIAPMSVAEFLARHPAADALEIVATRPRGRRYRYTAAAEDPVSQMVFVGTDGRGVLRYDPRAARFEPLSFGLTAGAVGAIARWDDGVWVGADAGLQAGGPNAGGLVWAASDLQRWQEAERPPGFATQWSVLHDLVVWEDATWAATDRGLLRVANGSFEMQGRTVGLPFSHTTALAASANALWVGATRGLVVRTRLGQFEVIADDASIGAVASLAFARDTLWVAGTRGLLVVDGNRAVDRAARVYRQPVLQEPLLSVAFRGDLLAVATTERVAWRPGAGRWEVGRALPELGGVRVVEVDPDDGLWIGGELGVMWLDLSSGAFRHAMIREDLPGAVRDLVATDAYLWVGTDGGLVRVRRDEIR